MTTNDPLQFHYELSAEEQEASAKGWEELADEQEARLAWDKQALPEMVSRLALLYRQVAARIRAKVAS